MWWDEIYGGMYAFLIDGAVVPIREDQFIEWSEWQSNIDNRRIAVTDVGDAHVSTVFLAIKHDAFGKTPMWFETMVSGWAEKPEYFRYPTLADAITGHELVVAWVKAVMSGGAGYEQFLSEREADEDE